MARIAPAEDKLVERIAAFLREIGLEVRLESIQVPTFLPGLTLCRNGLLVDTANLRYPGDMLHEAGHLALMTPAERQMANPQVDADLGREIGAIAWSWAALKHLDLDPLVVFHEGGYKGSSQAFVENFSAGRYVGVPYLQWLGLTTEQTFPLMLDWLRRQEVPTLPMEATRRPDE